MNPQQFGPVRLAGGPTLDPFEILGPIAQLIGSPGQDEDVLNRAQSQQIGSQFRETKYHEALPGLLDGGTEELLHLLGGNLLQARLNHGIKRRQFSG